MKMEMEMEMKMGMGMRRRVKRLFVVKSWFVEYLQTILRSFVFPFFPSFEALQLSFQPPIPWAPEHFRACSPHQQTPPLVPC
jgi:hypothetical protein